MHEETGLGSQLFATQHSSGCSGPFCHCFLYLRVSRLDCRTRTFPLCHSGTIVYSTVQNLTQVQGRKSATPGMKHIRRFQSPLIWKTDARNEECLDFYPYSGVTCFNRAASDKIGFRRNSTKSNYCSDILDVTRYFTDYVRFN